MKRILCFLMVILLLPGLLGTTLAGSGASVAQAADVKSHSGAVTIQDPTIEEIRAMYAQCQTPTQRFSEKPSVTAPYSTGKLDEDYMNNMLFYVNFYRYLAKLPAISLSEEKNTLAQYGAVLHAALKDADNFQVDHYPPKPADMSNEFYQPGYLAARLSNICGYNYRDRVLSGGWTFDKVEEHRITKMVEFAVMFQIRDYEPSDFRDVGHRRYLISPHLLTIGVGTADTPDNYVTYYFFDLATSDNPSKEITNDVGYDFYSWPPSGNCPNNMMGAAYPWSISLNEDVYKMPTEIFVDGNRTYEGDRSGIVVKVTRDSDGKTWTFDENSPTGKENGVNPRGYTDPYFNIDLHGYGYGQLRLKPGTTNKYEFGSTALVFRPDFEDNTPFEGTYQVHVTGLKYKDGSAAEISYQVNFFQLVTCEHEWGEWIEDIAPTCTEAGQKHHTCTKCGETETEPIEALGHDMGEWNETTAPTCTEDGEKSSVCNRCGTTLTEPVPALGHDMGEWNETTAPTCTEEGEKSSVCNRCGTTLTEPIAALGHDWNDGEITKEPNAEEDGVRTYTCTRCGETYTEPIPRNPFVDVPEEKYYFKPVLWAYYHNPRITSGTTETTFSPNKTCTRGQVVTFLWNALNEPEANWDNNPFIDVASDKYYFKPVLWAVENSVTGGADPTHFNPKGNCTRAQVVTFLWAASGRPEPTTTANKFEDVPESKYYFKAVLWAAENGITGGTDATHFSPNKICTRAQVVTFLQKCFDEE